MSRCILRNSVYRRTRLNKTCLSIYLLYTVVKCMNILHVNREKGFVFSAVYKNLVLQIDNLELQTCITLTIT